MLNIVKQIFSKVDASGLGEATKEDFINFLPSEIDTNSQLFSVIHKMEDASFGNEKKSTIPEMLESDPKILDNTGTSPLQLQIGFFRLVQGAAYRCFRASYTANSETHLRAYNLPYSITSFVSFVDRITQLYIDSGVIENNVIVANTDVNTNANANSSSNANPESKKKYISHILSGFFILPLHIIQDLKLIVVNIN